MSMTRAIANVSPVLGVILRCTELYGWTFFEADRRIKPYTEIGPNGLSRFTIDVALPDWLTTAILSGRGTPAAC